MSIAGKGTLERCHGIPVLARVGEESEQNKARKVSVFTRENMYRVGLLRTYTRCMFWKSCAEDTVYTAYVYGICQP